MQAPEKIWLQSDPENVGDGFPHEDFWEYVTWCASPINGSDLEYHLARPNQPCSTDSFLDKLFNERTLTDGDFFHRLNYWRMGNFIAAVKGLE